MNTSYPPPITSSRWGARTKRIVVIVILFFAGFVLWNLVEMLPLVVGSALLSYLLYPLVNFIEHNVLGVVLPFRARSLAVVMTFITVIALFVLAVIIIVPVLINQLADVGEALPRFLEAMQDEIEGILSRPLEFNGNTIMLGGEPIILMDRIQEVTGSGDGENILDAQNFDIFAVLGTFLGSVGSLTGPAFSVLGGAVNALINLSFLVVIMFYLMRDGEHFAIQFVNTVPESYRGDARRLLYELGVVWNAYLRGQLVLSLSVGFAVYLSALVLGLPNAPIFGLLAGLLEFIPNLGPFIALVPAAIIALFSESGTIPFLSGVPFALMVIVVWTAIQNVEAIFLVPRVMGGRLNLHPVVVILAVIAGASIAGAIGIILAAPFTATLRMFGQYLYGKVFDVDPFPNPKPTALDDVPEHPTRLYQLLSSINILRLFRGRRQGEIR